MKIGILANSEKNMDDIIGITRAATEKGHSVIIFAMDDGTKLFKDPSFAELCLMDGVSTSFCDHSAEEKGSETAGLPPEIVPGSQYNNATMVHESDRVIVL